MVQKSFTDAVKQANLKVAGYLKIEEKKTRTPRISSSTPVRGVPRGEGRRPDGRDVERPQVEVDDAAVDKTIQILQAAHAPIPSSARRATATGSRSISRERSTASLFPEARRKTAWRSAAAACCSSSRPRRAAWRRARRRASSPPSGRLSWQGGRRKSLQPVMTLKKIEEPRAPGVRCQPRRFRRRRWRYGEDAPRGARQCRARGEKRRRREAEGPGQAAGAALRHAARGAEVACRHGGGLHGRARLSADLKARGGIRSRFQFNPQAFEAAARRRVAPTAGSRSSRAPKTCSPSPPKCARWSSRRRKATRPRPK